MSRTIWNLYCTSKAFHTFPAHFSIRCASSFSIKKSPAGMSASNFPCPHLPPYLCLLCSLTFLSSVLGTKTSLPLSPKGMFILPRSHLLPSSHGPFPWVKQLLLKQTRRERSVGKASNWKLWTHKWKPFGWTIDDLPWILAGSALRSLCEVERQQSRGRVSGKLDVGTLTRGPRGLWDAGGCLGDASGKLRLGDSQG